MKFEMSYASDYRREETVEIATLEELMALIDRVGKIVLDSGSITVYDDYLE